MALFLIWFSFYFFFEVFCFLAVSNLFIIFKGLLCLFVGVLLLCRNIFSHPLLFSSFCGYCFHQFCYEYLTQAVPLLVGCPACLRNFLNLFCELSCSPDQSLFINVTSAKQVISCFPCIKKDVRQVSFATC